MVWNGSFFLCEKLKDFFNFEKSMSFNKMKILERINLIWKINELFGVLGFKFEMFSNKCHKTNGIHWTFYEGIFFNKIYIFFARVMNAILSKNWFSPTGADALLGHNDRCSLNFSDLRKHTTVEYFWNVNQQVRKIRETSSKNIIIYIKF